jgi:branched-chain amino acid transport system substrate-binding protein
MKSQSRVVVILLALVLVVAFLPVSSALGADSGQPTARAECMKGGWEDFANAGFRNQGDCIRFTETDVFTCRDPLGCVSYDEEDPLRLATALATSGPVGILGVDELRSVEIALAMHGPVLSHVIELSNEDSMCSSDGGEAAANAIVADPTIAAVVGTTCSIAARPAAPIISDAGYSMVSPSNTAPFLTAPDTHTAGYLRVSGNDADQGVTMAEFVRGEGAATSAVVVDGSAYTVTLAEAFVETFEGLGGTNLAFEIAEPDGSDVASVIAAVVAAGVPDVLYFVVFEPLGSAVVTEARATPALDGTQLAATDGLGGFDSFFETVGDDAEGMLFTVPDQSYTDTPEYAAFAAAYFDEFGEDPLTFSAFAFDASNLVLNGIEEVGIVDGAGTLHIGRQALREALFATAGFEGLTGTITCDPLGECGATEFQILTVDGGELVPVP